MSQIPQEKYYWDDFQQADRSSWQIIIFYFGVIGLITVSIFSNLDFNKWNEIILIAILCFIGLLLGIFVRNHLIKYRFYALRDEGYLITHDCHMLLRNLLFELKPKDGECLKDMKVDNKLKREFEKNELSISTDAKVIKIDKKHWEIINNKNRYIIKNSNTQTDTLLEVYGESTYEKRAKQRIRRDLFPLHYLSEVVGKLGIGFKYVFRFIYIANLLFAIATIGALCYLLISFILPQRFGLILPEIWIWGIIGIIISLIVLRIIILFIQQIDKNC